MSYDQSSMANRYQVTGSEGGYQNVERLIRDVLDEQ